MFDFSIGKVAILFALCLIVLGPEKLPKLAAQLGRFAGQARAMARHFRAQLEQEIAAEELKKEIQAADEAIAKLAAETPPRRTAESSSSASPPAQSANAPAQVSSAENRSPAGESTSSESTSNDASTNESGGPDKPSSSVSV